MKLLDKYIAKNFLVGYGIFFGVLMGLRVIIDLFVNIDEFAEQSGIGFFGVLGNILSYYAINSALYFRDFAGIIIVVAASFSIGKMVRSGEFVALMASGVSLTRVIVPILILALILTGLVIIDQEIIIPSLAPHLVRARDALPGEETYRVEFITDANGALIRALNFDVKTATMNYPTILTRRRIPNSLSWTVTGVISAKEAVYDEKANIWRLVEGRYTPKASATGAEPIESFSTDLTPTDIPLRHRAQHLTLLSSSQLSKLAANPTKVRDLAQLHSQKQFRITDPLINIVMLLISLPVLICRDPRSMKSAIAISFVLTGACFITTFICKMMATEVFFENIIPAFWAWLPVFIFLPIAVIEIDSMKT
ncbi:MAG: LptF/LptG family permease [Phycisphaerae bacterium]